MVYRPFPGRVLITSDALVRKKAPASHTADFYQYLIDSRQGYEVLWARALLCPCRANEQTEQPDPSCPKCMGTGWRYVHPHPELYPNAHSGDGTLDLYQGEQVRGLMQGMRTSPETQREGPGQFIPGYGKLTLRADVDAGFMDRFVAVDATLPYDQVLRRQAADLLPIGYQSRTELRYPVVRVLALHDATTRYRLRTDFTITALGQINFVTGRGPTEDSYLTVRYLYHPRWVVVNHPRDVIGFRQGSKQSGIPGDRYKPLPRHFDVALDHIVRPA